MTREREPINFESPKDFSAKEKLTIPEFRPEETESIISRANLRRQQYYLNKEKAKLKKTSEDSRHTNADEKIQQEINGEPVASENSKELESKITSLRQKAKLESESSPDLAAYLYAKAARLELAHGQNGFEDIAQARECFARSEKGEKTNPSQLMPQAAILGVEKELIKNLPLPDKKRIVSACQNNDVLREYALILPEEERAEFLALFPKDRQVFVSIVLDLSASEFLPESFAKSKDEQNQRNAILDRSANALKQVLNESQKGSSESVRLLCETLIRLQGEDSLRQLVEVGKIGLSKNKNPEQQAERYEYLGQIIDHLFQADTAKGGLLAVKLIGKKDLQSQLFKDIFEKCLDKKVLTDKSKTYFSNESNWPFLRKLIAQYPNQFNTVIDTLSQIKNYDPAKNESEVFQALSDLDSITPIIFERYRRADAPGKKELARQIRDLKPKFFQNTPIKNILPRGDQEILAEMVYLAYQPVGMSFESVKSFIEKVEDHTDDLKSFKFPKDGYDFVMETGKRFVLKPGERLDQEKLRSLRDLFIGKMPQSEEEIDKISKLLKRSAEAGTDFKPEELAILLSIMSSDQPVRNFLERSKNLSPDNHYTYLNELKELLGVYFTDNYHERLKNFLSANPKIEGRLVKILSLENRQTVLRKKLAKDGESLDWTKITSHEEIAKALAVFIQTKALKSIREENARMLNKFIESEGQTALDSSSRKLKAFISKNVGSFFAKASAGICTAEDVTLFNRKDHFHINIVENEQDVQGNIQAYIIKDPEGGQSLVLRGFNPNTAFLGAIDPGAFCETVLKVAGQFQKDNKMTHLYITEQLGGWHALSNREQVAQYLQKKYVSKKREKQFSLQITSSQKVNHLYIIN